MTTTYHLSDKAIARIVQIIQEGIVTMTDVTDHLRTLKLEVEEGSIDRLVPTKEYMETIEKYHNRLLDRAIELSEELKSPGKNIS